MSRPRGISLAEQSVKLDLIAEKLNCHTHSKWCDILDIGSEATIHNWYRGSRISRGSLSVIARKVGISVEDFSLPAAQFGEHMGLSSALVNHVIRSRELNQPSAQAPNINDASILAKCCGEYGAVYLCRHDNDVSKEYIALRRFRIGPLESPGQAYFCQLKNFITAREESGSVRCVNERFVAAIKYTHSYYPDSIYYLMPLVVEAGISILYGIYTDITAEPSKEVFATRILFFKLSDVAVEARNIEQESPLFSGLKQCVNNETASRTRLITNPGYEAIHEIIKTVRHAKEALEGKSSASPNKVQ